MMPQHDNGPCRADEQQDVSLDALADAFAEVIGGRTEGPDLPPDGAPPDEAARSADELPDTGTGAVTEPAASPDECCPITPCSILEAMLFVGNRGGRGLSAQQAADLMHGVEAEEIPRLVHELNERYTHSGRPYTIVDNGGNYRLTLRPAFAPVRNRFYGRVREARLSQAAIDVLSIVAYEQPLSSEEVSRQRGKPSSHVLAQLVRRGLLRVERRGSPRRTAYYRTTDRFLELFSLESLDDLPRSEELER
jgi:segregation and condensation protein B